MGSTVSSWRPPWLDTITPATPSSAAVTASSTVRMPLSTIGSGLSATKRSMSLQFRSGSTSAANCCGVIVSVAPAASAARRPRSPAVRHGSPQLALAHTQDGEVDRDHQRLEAAGGGTGDELGADPAVVEDVELKPPGPGGDRLGQRLGRGRGQRREAHDRFGRAPPRWRWRSRRRGGPGAGTRSARSAPGAVVAVPGAPPPGRGGRLRRASAGGWPAGPRRARCRAG